MGVKHRSLQWMHQFTKPPDPAHYNGICMSVMCLSVYFYDVFVCFVIQYSPESTFSWGLLLVVELSAAVYVGKNSFM